VSVVLPIADVRTDGGTQPRAQIDLFVVADYRDALESGAKFPPVVVFFDGEAHWLADGFHRLDAHRDAGRVDIDVDLRRGTRRDAVLYSVGANDDHGLRRTNADKRRAVETLLRDAEWSLWSDNELARRACVSVSFVGKVRSSLSTVDSERRFTTKHGTQAVMNTAAIGRGGKLDEATREAVRAAGLQEDRGVVYGLERISDEETRRAAVEKIVAGEARNVQQATRQLAEEKRVAAAPQTERVESRVYATDAIALLTDLDCRPHCLVTDPPYGLETHRTREGGRDYADGEDYALCLLNDVCALAATKLDPSAHLYVFSGYSYAHAFKQILGAHFDVQDNPIVWVKDNHTMCDFAKWYPSKHEYVWFAKMRGSERRLAACVPDVINCARARESTHSAEKPVELLETFIRQSTTPGELVFDPFTGSGSTAVAAANLRRSFVGCELDEKWVRVARARAAEAAERAA